MSDYLNKFRLDGKTALIVGGVGLIGREVSIALASSGARTIILEREEKESLKLIKELNHKGYNAKYRFFNCADMENLEKDFSRCLNEFKKPDIFINCSYPRTKDWAKSSFAEIKLSSFRRNVDIHMNSYAWLARLVAEEMKDKENQSTIIQLGSIYGILGQDMTVYENTEIFENMTYSAIKGGIDNLSRQMASYYGQFNIRINTLVPGGLAGHVSGANHVQDPLFVEKYSEKTPLKRLGKAEEIAATALFLASDASSYITGATIVVDGGWTIV